MTDGVNWADYSDRGTLKIFGLRETLTGTTGIDHIFQTRFTDMSLVYSMPTYSPTCYRCTLLYYLRQHVLSSSSRLDHGPCHRLSLLQAAVVMPC